MQFEADFVSILARPVGRALQTKVIYFNSAFMFQSSPVLWDGRYTARLIPPNDNPRFNPRPSCGTGATIDRGDNALGAIVSILARPVGRALRRPYSFPRGDLCVSILARPVGRALRKVRHGQRLSARFNPRPSCGTGATQVRHRRSAGVTVSILARPVGRALRLSLRNTHKYCQFQSSPVLWDGRYSSRWLYSGGNFVSILARPVGRALPLIHKPAGH